MRRVVGEVGHERYEGSVGDDLMNALTERAIEIRDHGQNQVSFVLLPIPLQCAHDGTMPHSDCAVQQYEQLRSQACPALAQDQVVPILQPNVRNLLQRIDSIKQFLQIQEFDLPRALLPLDDTLQSIGCVAMSTTGIKEYDRQLAHQSSQPSAFTQVLSGDC